MVRNCNRWHESLAPGLVFDILTHHSSTRGATKQLLDRNHIDALQFSASLGLEMNALYQSKKLWSHLGVAVQSWERQLMKIWQKSLRSWRIMRTWIVAFFSSKNPEDVDCLFGRIPEQVQDVTELDLSHNKIKDAGVQATFLMTWCYVFLVNTILSHPYRKGLHLVYKWLYLKFGCDQALVAALAAGAAPKLRELKLYRTLWGGEHSWCLWDLKNSETRERVIQWCGCMTHSQHSKLFVVSMTVTPSHLSCAVMNSGSWQRRCSRRAFQFSEKTWRLGWFH